VTYADDLAISVASLGSGTDVVVNPGAIAATFVSVDVATDGTPRVATYSITPPGGAWDAADNGTYTIAMQASQVTDTSANAVAAGTIGTFTVSVPDTTAPTVVTSSATANGTGTLITITVTYQDDVAIDVSTLGMGDLAVSGPSGFTATPFLVSVDVSSNGTPRVATYQVSSGSGLANGTYTASLVASQVADTSGNTAAAATLGSATVSVSTSTTVTTTTDDSDHGAFRESTGPTTGHGGDGSSDSNSGFKNVSGTCSMASAYAPASPTWAPLTLAVLALLAVRRRRRR
jgi:large repetitive protein